MFAGPVVRPSMSKGGSGWIHEREQRLALSAEETRTNLIEINRLVHEQQKLRIAIKSQKQVTDVTDAIDVTDGRHVLHAPG